MTADCWARVFPARSEPVPFLSYKVKPGGPTPAEIRALLASLPPGSGFVRRATTAEYLDAMRREEEAIASGEWRRQWLARLAQIKQSARELATRYEVVQVGTCMATSWTGGVDTEGPGSLHERMFGAWRTVLCPDDTCPALQRFQR